MSSTESKQHPMRWLLRSELSEVLTISRQCPSSWNQEQFLEALRERNCIGMVATDGELIVGFIVYDLHKTRFEILNIGVESYFRRKGVGTDIIAMLKRKMANQGRHTIRVTVSESNLTAQQFFRSQGFKAVRVFRGHFEGPDEDGYQMEFTTRSEQGR